MTSSTLEDRAKIKYHSTKGKNSGARRSPVTRELEDYVSSLAITCNPADTLQTTYLKSLDEYAVNFGEILLGFSNENKRRTNWESRAEKVYALLDDLEVLTRRKGMAVNKHELADRLEHIQRVVEIASTGEYVKKYHGDLLVKLKETVNSRIASIAKDNSDKNKAYQEGPREGASGIIDYFHGRILNSPYTNGPREISAMRENIIGGDSFKFKPERIGFGKRIKSWFGRALNYLDLTALPKISQLCS